MITKNNSTIAKSICILFIVLQHWEQCVGFKYLDVVNYVGGMGCAGFFFLSAYGLSQSYKKENSKRRWMRNFVVRRITNIFIPLLISNILYIILFVDNNIYDLSTSMILNYLFVIELVNGHFWFMQALIIMYFAFWLSNMLTNNFKLVCTILFVCASFYVFLVGKNVGSSTVFAFLGGYIYSYSNNVLRLNKFTLSIVVLILIVSFYTCFYRQFYFGVFFVIHILAFLWFIIAIFEQTEFPTNSWLYKYGMISFEIYLTNALALHLFAKPVMMHTVFSLPLYLAANIFFALLLQSIVRITKTSARLEK